MHPGALRVSRRVALLGYCLVPLGAALSFALVAALRFTGLEPITALDHAQVARNLADAHGYTTSAIRPLSLLFHPGAAGHPDLYNAPLHPFLLGLWYCLFGASDGAVLLLSGVLWVASVCLTFAVARAWFGTGVGALAALCYGASRPAMLDAAAGLPHVLAAMLVLLAVWLIAPHPSEEEWLEVEWGDGPRRTPPRRLFFAGAACALAVLTAYPLIVLPLAAMAYLAITEPRGSRPLIPFLAGFTLLLLPWMVRNYRVIGSPFFSLFWYEALSGTPTYPGDTLWRSLAQEPPSPLAFLLQHPRQAILKVLSGLVSLPGIGVRGAGPLLLVLGLLAMLWGTGTGRWRVLTWSVAGSMALCGVLSCLLRLDASLLLVWLPLIAIAGAAAFGARLEGWGEWAAYQIARASGHRLLDLDVFATRIITAAVVVPTLLPLSFLLARGPASAWGAGRQKTAPLHGAVPKTALVAADRPAAVAWYGGRQAVGLCRSESDWDALERLAGPVGAIYTLGTPRGPAASDPADLWRWFALRMGRFRDLALVPQPWSAGVLRVRLPQGARSAAAPAIVRARAAAARAPRSAMARNHLGDAYLAEDRLYEATREYMTALRYDRENVPACLALSVIAMRTNDTTTAVTMARRALRSSGEGAQAYVHLGAALLQARNFEDALSVFERGMARHPRDVRLLVGAARCLAATKRWVDAVEYCRRAARMAPNWMVPYSEMAALLITQGKPAAAAAELAPLAKRHPNEAVVRGFLGRALLDAGRPADALPELMEAQRLAPRWDAPYTAAGVACLRLRRPNEAAGHLAAALRIAPNSLDAGLALAQVSLEQKNRPAAVAIYKRVLAAHPENQTALNNLVCLYLDSGQDVERAMRSAEQLAAANPRNGLFQDTLGWAYYQAKRRPQALHTLREAARLAPENGTVHYHLGKVLLADGQRSEAERALRRALSKDLPENERHDAQQLVAPAGGG